MEKQSNTKKQLVKGAALLGVAGLIVKIIGALFRIPLANIVGPLGMSYYEAAYPYYSLLLVVSSAGVPIAVSKLVSERITLNDPDGANRVFSTALKLLSVMGLVSGIAMYFGAEMLANLSTFKEAYLSFRALAPALLFSSMICAFRGYLQGHMIVTGTALSQVVEQVGKLVISLALAKQLLPMGAEYAAFGALIGISLSEFLSLVVIMLFYFRKRSQMRIEADRFTEPVSKMNRSIFKSLLMISVPIAIGASINSLAGVLDSVLIGRMLIGSGFEHDAAKIAYSLLRTNVNTLINMPSVFSMGLAIVLVPAVSSAVVKRDLGTTNSIAQTGMKLAMLIGTPCAVGLGILAEPILRLLYPVLSPAELLTAAELLRISAAGVLFLSLIQTMTGVIQGMGKQVVPVINLFIGFIIKVISMIVLMRIPSMNIKGAAISTVLCFMVTGILDTIYVLRKTRMKIKYSDTFIKPIIASAVMGAVALAASTLLTNMGHRTLAALGGVGAGVLVYAALLFALKMLSEQDLEYIPGGGKIKKIMYGRKTK